MRKIEAVCPYCAKAKTIETSGTATNVSLKCAQCSKSWDEDLSEAGSLAKSAPVPSSELAGLRVQLNAQFAELLSKLQGLTERRATAPASFQPQREETATVLKFVAGMPGGVMLESDIADSAEASRQHPTFVTKAANGDAVAHAELEKALANGRPVTSHEYERIGESGTPARFQPVPNIAVSNSFAPAFGGGTVEKTVTPAPAEHRPFHPNGNTDLSKADAAVRHALANGKKV
jgi:hypothetical protein